MRELSNRLGAGLAVAIVTHLAAAACFSVWGYSFSKTPPQILEVTLASGGGGSTFVEEESHPEEKNLLQSLDDIIDEKLKPKPKPLETPKPKKEPQQTASKTIKNAAVTAKPDSGADKSGANNSTKAGSGEGTDAGNKSGAGSGQGDGHGVPVVPPRIITTVPPKYPPFARKQGIEGVAYVKMLVGSDGKVEEAVIVTSSGNTEMDHSALAAVQKWRFSPSKDKFGKKVRCYVTQGVRFDLRYHN